jgi:hypothetical protein
LGVFLGWLGGQLKWIHDRREAQRWIIDVRARQLARERGSSLPPEKGRYVSHDGINAPKSLQIFGQAGVGRVEVYQEWLNSDAFYSLEELRRLFPEADVKAVPSPPPTSRQAERPIYGTILEHSARANDL